LRRLLPRRGFFAGAPETLAECGNNAELLLRFSLFLVANNSCSRLVVVVVVVRMSGVLLLLRRCFKCLLPAPTKTGLPGVTAGLPANNTTTSSTSLLLRSSVCRNLLPTPQDTLKKQLLNSVLRAERWL
jgi:hypothetical protein